ncbi:40S ribosomal SA-like [Olea europaea subsp. europaea]|uniref:40S ribosomal SA-like n=1 Tax=Olea europaea subsp. europaea TaxID=158383 RepID=A0A8S0SGK8_OLEEU|nr:40S ribosomal SA-like [Olea europaea subsp. europaea]
MREPQEAKEQEEKETPALPDYVDYFTAPVGGDWSSNQILDAQWAPEMASTLTPVASGWTGEAGSGDDGVRWRTGGGGCGIGVTLQMMAVMMHLRSWWWWLLVIVGGGCGGAL